VKNRGKNIALTITVISIALIGLISLQVYLLKESYEQKEQAFDRNVLNVLTAVSQQIEKDEAASKIFAVALQPPPGNVLPARTIKRFKNGRSKGIRTDDKTNISWVIAESTSTGNGKQMRLEVFHSSGIDTLPTVMIRKHTAPERNQQSFSYSYSTENGKMKVQASLGDPSYTVFSDTTRKRRGEIVAQVVDKLFLMETLPIEQRLNVPQIDSMLGSALLTAGIATPFLFRVTAGANDTVRLTNDSSASWRPSPEPYRTRLFPNDLLSPGYHLSVSLPDKSSFVLGEMSLLLALSLLFVAFLLASVVYIVRVMILQKRFADSVIDFINNMTHEFKTPISTIALASEAIAKPEVLKSRPRLRKYNSIIADENNRMKHQVDTILQMAVLERGEFELKRTTVDMHAVIQHAAANAALLAELRNGTVSVHLLAKDPIVNGDSVHLANIIHNLLDNAVKYSPVLPTISVNTEDVPSGLRIRIADNGIGIAKEDLPRVFERYFRVSTGNTHDVKGFGLGLSYVQLITNAHRGTVTINSTPGRGTIVEVTLPR
jgi:two-component system phosphate regulon sensor histidine kinase PhoR